MLLYENVESSTVEYFSNCDSKYCAQTNDATNVTTLSRPAYGLDNDTWGLNHTNIDCSITYSAGTLSSPMFQAAVYTLYSTVFFVALTGNGLVCYVVQMSPRMKSVTNYFIVNLAVGDILMSLFCVPFSFVSTLILNYWPFGALMCRLVNYSQAVSVFVSAYTLVAISLDRYMAIMRPLRPRMGRAAAKTIVAAVWGGALATAAPIPVVSQLERPTAWHAACQMDICMEKWSRDEELARYTAALLALQFALPLAALAGTYARIAHAVCGGRTPGEAHGERDHRLARAKRKMIKMMVTVVIVFIICWLPLNVLVMAWTWNAGDVAWDAWPALPYVWFAAHWLAMSHSCYNPIIYCYMNARYRRGFKQALSRAFCLESAQDGRGVCRSSMGGDGLALTEFHTSNGFTHQKSLSTNACKTRVATAPARALTVRHHEFA